MRCVLIHCWCASEYCKDFNNPISGSSEKIKEMIETWQPKFIIWSLI